MLPCRPCQMLQLRCIGQGGWPLRSGEPPSDTFGVGFAAVCGCCAPAHPPRRSTKIDWTQLHRGFAEESCATAKRSKMASWSEGTSASTTACNAVCTFVEGIVWSVARAAHPKSYGVVAEFRCAHITMSPNLAVQH